MEEWKKIGEREVLSSRWGKELVSQEYEHPVTKKREDYVFLSYGKSPVIVFAITESNEVILIRVFRHAAGRVFLELPGGVPEVDEPLDKTAERELLEETGYQAEKVFPLADEIWFDPQSVGFPFHPFLALGCVKTDSALDAVEHTEVVAMPIQNWIQMVMNAEISDSKSIAVTMLALRHAGFSLHRSENN